MKKNLILILVAAAFGGALVGCSKKEDAVSFATLEDARSQARQNAEVNARAYVRENPRMQGMDVVGHGDSTQSAKCPQGDGWASLSVMKADSEVLDAKGKPSIEKYKIKCSTVSANLGCYLESDFKNKPFSSEENVCNPTLPFPLPKVVGK